MNEDTYTNQLRKTALDMGADLFGVTSVRSFEDPEYTGNSPSDIMEDARSVIVLGVAVPRGSIESLPKGRAEYTNTLMAGTATIRVIAFRLARLIEKKATKPRSSPRRAASSDTGMRTVRHSWRACPSSTRHTGRASGTTGSTIS